MKLEDARAIRRMMDRAMSRVRGVVTRATISGTSQGANGATMAVSMLTDESHAGAEYFEPYGVSGSVPNGADAIVLSIGGSRDNLGVVCASPRGSEPTGKQSGEVDYWSIHGQKIRHHTGGDTSIAVGAAGILYLGSEPNLALPFVARSGDPVAASAPQLTWAGAVTAALATLTGGSFAAQAPPIIGSVQSTSTKVKSS